MTSASLRRKRTKQSWLRAPSWMSHGSSVAWRSVDCCQLAARAGASFRSRAEQVAPYAHSR